MWVHCISLALYWRLWWSRSTDGVWADWDPSRAEDDDSDVHDGEIIASGLCVIDTKINLCLVSTHFTVYKDVNMRKQRVYVCVMWKTWQCYVIDYEAPLLYSLLYCFLLLIYFFFSIKMCIQQIQRKNSWEVKERNIRKKRTPSSLLCLWRRLNQLNEGRKLTPCCDLSRKQLYGEISKRKEKETLSVTKQKERKDEEAVSRNDSWRWCM